MVLFQSMTQVVCYISISVALFVAYSTSSNPLKAAGHFMQMLLTSRVYLFHFLALIAILLVNKFELSLEDQLNLTVNYTPDIFQYEGLFVHNLQQLFANDLLTAILSYFYVVIFPSLLISSLIIYTHARKPKLFQAVCYALMFNYIVAIPFFVFFPINEVWSYGPAKVSFLMLHSFPTFETAYRPMSGLDNCFPSLHTSISVTLATLAIYSRNRVWAIVCCLSAAIIIFSIFYLGIHWITDMAGGVVLGVCSAVVAVRIAERRSLFGSLFGSFKQHLLQRRLRNKEVKIASGR